MITRILIPLLVLLSLGAAPTTTPTIELGVISEEGKPLIRALVKVNDKPIENASVRFWVKRTFGKLPLGEDKTLDDGTAAVKFPTNLPGGSTGMLHVIAEITAPAQYVSRIESDLPGGVQIVPNPDPFPRAFWAPHAPLALVITIFALLAGVWSTYLFVISQVIAIRKGAKS